MGFSWVKFNNFRNLEPREIKWSPGLNLLIGENGSGKTNVLEGINLISGWGPLERGTISASMATWNSGIREVRLSGHHDGKFGETVNVKIAGRYMIKLDGKVVSATELRYKFPVLTFLPCDIEIVDGSASYRRRFLDMLLALFIPSYAVRLNDYKRCMKHKSVLLRRGMPTDMIDKAVAPLAAWLWKMREEGITFLCECMDEINGIVPSKLSLSFKRGGAGRNLDSREEDFRVSIFSAKEKEKVLKFPLVGPHRDDILILSEGKPASESLSRGYRRRAAISLMLAACDGIKRKLGKSPVLLLDEVTAELDETGRKILFSSLEDRNTQVFAATAEPNIGNLRGKVYTVTAGRVENCDEN